MQEGVNSLIRACGGAFQAGDYALAIRLAERLIELRPERPEPWKVRAEALAGLARHDEAIDAYAQALRVAPSDTRLRVRRARVLARTARHTEALAEYERAFAADPASLAALHGLVGYREVSPDDPALGAVRAIARGAPASPGARSFACFLLGRILTLTGCDDEGFRFYAEANRLTHEALRDAPGARGPEEFLRWWAPRIAAAPDAWHRGIREAAFEKAGMRVGQSACPAVLVAGLPRSGKSLVEHLICAHPALAAGDELGELHEVIESLQGPPQSRLAALTAAQPDPLVEGCARALHAAQRPGARLLVDTAPANLWELGYLAALHPEVPVILCRRDPLDLGAAIFFKKFRFGHAWSYDLADLGRMLAVAERAIDIWRRALPNPVQVVDYEALVADPRGVRDTLLRGLGLDPAQCGDTTAETDLSVPPSPHTPAARAHASHSPDGYGAVTAELVGFGARFAHGLAPMTTAYRAASAGQR